MKVLRPVSGEDIKKGLIDNSQTLSVGEVIIPAVQGDTKVVKTGGGTTAALLGIVLGIEGKGGKVLEKNTIAAASDNVTVDMIQVSFLPFHIPMEFEALLDADAETTDDSSAYGNFAIEAGGITLDESTYVAFTTIAAKQFFSYGLVDSNNSSRKVTCHYMRNAGI